MFHFFLFWCLFPFQCNVKYKQWGDCTNGLKSDDHAPDCIWASNSFGDTGTYILRQVLRFKWSGDPGTYIGSQIQSRRSSCPTLHSSHLETGFWRIWIRSRLIFPCKRFSWTEILSVENYMNAQSVLKCVAEWPDKSFLKWFTENLIALPSSLNGAKLFSKVGDMETHLEGKGH